MIFSPSEDVQASAQEIINKDQDVILFVSFIDDDVNNTIQEAIGAQYSVFSTTSFREALNLLDNIMALCISCGCLSEDALELLAAASNLGKGKVPCIVLIDTINEDNLHKYREAGEVIYVMPRVAPSNDVIAILATAVARRDNHKAYVDQRCRSADIEDITQPLKLLDLIKNVVVQDDVYAACELVAQSLSQTFNADYGYCLNYNARSRILNGISPNQAVEFQQSVSAGLLGFVALTGRSGNVFCLEEDPRYLPGVDVLGGGNQARLLTCSVRDAQCQTQAVLALVRSPSKPVFSEQDEKELSFLAQHLAAPLSRFKLEAQLVEAPHSMRETVTWATDAYRAEALAHYAGSLDSTGDLLHLSPGWTRWVYWLLLMCFGAALLYSTLAKVTEYAAGPAVIFLSGYIHGVVPVDCRPHAAEQTYPTMASAFFGERRPSLIAFIPGKYRPELQPGMNLRLKLSGFQYTHQMLTVKCVGEQVVSPAQVKRYLSARSAYTVTLSGPVVPVFATLPATTFQANSRRYAYYDGMGATAEVKTDSERLIYALVPGLKRWISQHGD